MNRLHLLLLLIPFLMQCTPSESLKESLFPSEKLKVSWELVTNQLGGESKSQAAFTISNESEETLGNKGWALYFNMLPRNVENVSGNVKIERINGDFFRLIPTENFTPLSKGESIRITYEEIFGVVSKSGAPNGLYWVFSKENGEEFEPQKVANFQIQPFTKPEQVHRSKDDKFPLNTAAYRYEQNQTLSSLPEKEMSKVVPTPIKVKTGKNKLTLDQSFQIFYAEELEGEAKFLQSLLKPALGTDLNMSSDAPTQEKVIFLSIKKVKTKGVDAEAYTLEIDPKKGITIEGNTEMGIFYGIQSLRALLPYNITQSPQSSFEIEEIKIEDAPRFSYRGLHLDVSRNFHTKAEVLKLLDLMAFYKLNKFHFHLTDDEGWRLETPTLPELTEYGSKRGHTLDESENLYPSYGSGPFHDTSGSGFYSKADFIEILKYAKERHIEVIPEIDMPGHARAAIKAMEYRYRKLTEEGKTEEAKEFLLSELNDQSEYSSAQWYTDNVVCVCQNSTYRFLEVVVEDVQKMYAEADVPLNIIHTGGDEVPKGVWEKSPVCKEFFAQNPDVNNVNDLHEYFLERFYQINQKYNFVTAGWEEIAQMKVEKEGKMVHVLNPDFVDKNFLSYVWNTVYGWGGEDMAYQLANAGYKVVMCNAPNLYFDLAYAKDFEEAGLYWAAFVNTRNAYELAPYDLFKTAKTDKMGNDLGENFGENMVKLNKKARENILGIQGQLWTETVKNQSSLEYYLFPKMLGLAEKAWAQPAQWEETSNAEKRQSQLDVAWNQFANTLGQREFPRLTAQFDVNYRIPQPGAIIEDGKLYANIAYLGLTIRYTTDGSEPSADSPEYVQPVAVNSTIRLKAFDQTGRGSRVTEVE